MMMFKITDLDLKVQGAAAQKHNFVQSLQNVTQGLSESDTGEQVLRRCKKLQTNICVFLSAAVWGRPPAIVKIALR